MIAVLRPETCRLTDIERLHCAGQLPFIHLDPVGHHAIVLRQRRAASQQAIQHGVSSIETNPVDASESQRRSTISNKLQAAHIAGLTGLAWW